MTELLLHTLLSVVLIAWAYMVATRVKSRRASVWFGVGPLVLIGYLSLIAKSVFDGVPATVQTVVGNVAATLMLLAGIFCLVLFAAVSRSATLPVAAPGAAIDDVSAWGPRNEEPVIVPEGAEDWDSGSVIDAGSWPFSPPVDEKPRAGRYAYASPDETEAPESATPARGVASPAEPVASHGSSTSVAPPATAAYARVTPPTASVFAPPPPSAASAPLAGPIVEPFAPPTTPVSAPTAVSRTAVYTPVAPPPVAASEWSTTSSADDDAWEQAAPRRALPPHDGDDEY